MKAIKYLPLLALLITQLACSAGLREQTKTQELDPFFGNTDTLTLAFPGAEGAGRFTTGGRGGEVYFVTTLQDTMAGDKKTREGTLRWCLNRKGPKTILFQVAGVIYLERELNVNDNTTILGQSAPGDGICIAGDKFRIKGDNIIVRYLRFRLGDITQVEDDAISSIGNKNVIIDHCSMSWGTDECGSFYDNENFTLQWCILAESLRESVHKKGSHGYGGIWGGQNATFHHNLLAHHDSRNPRLCGSRFSAQPDRELVDFRNNVIYNWGQNSSYAGEGGRYNIVNNYYQPGVGSKNRSRIFQPDSDEGKYKQAAGVWGSFYVSGNVLPDSPKVTADNTLGFHPTDKTKNKEELLVSTPFPTPLVVTHSAEEAYQLVLDHAGASFHRDPTDTRIIKETREKLCPVKSEDENTRPGLINSQTEVGGWDAYTFSPEQVLPDTDRDGIPDGWLEKNHPGKTAQDRTKEGYTYLEVYYNQLLSAKK
ncbi:pectate lyase [Bacteroidales bacterium OttesenSCG-928-J19]|nr:pectate lyase [Bacteroidales bacterium OttesenSCG-928-J19]